MTGGFLGDRRFKGLVKSLLSFFFLSSMGEWPENSLNGFDSIKCRHRASDDSVERDVAYLGFLIVLCYLYSGVSVCSVLP